MINLNLRLFKLGLIGRNFKSWAAIGGEQGKLPVHCQQLLLEGAPGYTVHRHGPINSVIARLPDLITENFHLPGPHHVPIYLKSSTFLNVHRETRVLL